MAQFDVQKATRLNPLFAKGTRPPWGTRFHQVVTLLGFVDMTPGPEAFSEAVYSWQKQQPGLPKDGILGAGSWARMEPLTRFTPNLSPARPNWLSDVAQEAAQVDSTLPMSGAIPFGIGLPSIVRIPVPGTNGLAIELTPRGFTPQGGSTSTLFIQDTAGGRQLRLDYGFNKTTNAIDYHWNQKGTHADFGITDHTSVGRAGRVGYRAAKYFRYGGRVLVVVGAALDFYSIVVASRRLKRASEVASAWALAWVGCKVVGAGGAKLGTLAEPGLGTAIGGVGGCIVGGIAGYAGGEALGGEVYEWVEETVFTRVPEAPQP